MLTRNRARYELTSGTSDHHARSDGGMSPWSPPLQNPQRWASRVLSNRVANSITRRNPGTSPPLYSCFGKHCAISVANSLTFPIAILQY
jgi:hypothetical protein